MILYIHLMSLCIMYLFQRDVAKAHLHFACFPQDTDIRLVWGSPFDQYNVFDY